MLVALRALILLAAVTPLFVATAFRPAWWQTLIAAAIGSAIGQLAVRFARERRVAQWVVAGVAAIAVGAGAAWPLVQGRRHEAPEAADFFVVSGKSLTWDDVHAIETRVPSIDRAVPYRSETAQVIADDQNWNTRVVGTTNDYFDLVDVHLAAGERFDETSGKVVVLGDTVARNVFGAQGGAVGEVVRIKGVPFDVIGVLGHRGMSAQGQDLDDLVLMPMNTFLQKLAGGLTSSFGGVVLVAPRVKAEMARVEADVRSLLRERHRLDPAADDDFTLRRP